MFFILSLAASSSKPIRNVLIDQCVNDDVMFAKYKTPIRTKNKKKREKLTYSHKLIKLRENSE